MPKTATTKLRLTKITEYRDQQGTCLRFVPVDAVPGFTHRVVINGVALDWLGEGFSTSAKSARYFLEKHNTTSHNTT